MAVPATSLPSLPPPTRPSVGPSLAATSCGSLPGAPPPTPAGCCPLPLEPIPRACQGLLAPIFPPALGVGGATPSALHAVHPQSVYTRAPTHLVCMCRKAVHRGAGVLCLRRNHSSAPWPSCSSEAGGWRYQRTMGKSGFAGRDGVHKALQALGSLWGVRVPLPGVHRLQATQPGHRTCPQGKHVSTQRCHLHRTCTSPRTQFGSLHASTHMRAAGGWTHMCVPGTHVHTHTRARSRLCTAHRARGVWGETAD